MNRAYQLIRNTTGQFVPAPEYARRRPGPCRRLALAVAIASLSGTVMAGPEGGVVTDGSASITRQGNVTDIDQQSQNATLEWDSFDIGADETVNFRQPGQDAIALNRVFSADGTQIHGQLNANGRLFVLDANGVLFGENAQVNVGSLVASSLDIRQADFDSERFTLSGGGQGAAVTNLGEITAADTGAVALLGGQVSNRGVIRARLGSVTLAAGEVMTLDFAGDGLLNVQVDEAALDALAENHGLIRADGGQVLMTAHASDALLQTVVNNTGVVEARGIEERDGRIMLMGGMDQETGGSVRVSGTLDASSETGPGGFVETSGEVVKVTSDATIDTSGAEGQGGNWLLDPTNLEISYDPEGADDEVSHVHVQALQNSLAGGNVTLETVDSGSEAGDISILDPVIWSSSNSLTLAADGGITFSDYLHAPNGGLVLDAQGDITTGGEGHINVGAFTLNSGNWQQVGATLPTFIARDFTLNGGSFTRALGGDGSGSPLQVTDVYGLQGLASTPDLNAVLDNDIDASDTGNWNSGAGFVPVGNETTPFSGTFDGQGHAIDGLTIARAGEADVGLFGSTAAVASIDSLALNGVAITGGEGVGALVGSHAGSIGNSYVSGGTVEGDSKVGGLVGSNAGEIGNSYVTTAVTGNDTVGGLAGTNDGDITSSYASGAVSGSSTVGGLLGENTDSVISSYWDSSTTTQGTGIGNDTGSSAINQVNGDWDASPDAYEAGSYSELDFTGSWFISEGHSRPMLQAFLSGDGSISNIYQLQGMAADLTGDYMLTQDIDASVAASGNTSDVWGGRGFAPVGADVAPFAGSLDGQGFVIHGLTIDRPGSRAGLFDETASGAVIRHLGLEDVAITGGTYQAPLVAYNRGTITGSYSTGAVGSDGSILVGGLVGLNEGSISESYSTASVEAGGDAGGLVAMNNGSILDSYATGAVSGADYAGGLVGTNDGTISDSYASGPVSDGGGLGVVGGLVGINAPDGNITDSYWDGHTTETGSTGVGSGDDSGATQLNGNWGDSAVNAYEAASYTGFDFDNTWFIAEGHSRPMLRAFLRNGGTTSIPVSSAYELQGMAANLGGDYYLTGDIDVSGIAPGDISDTWGGRGFAPVGTGGAPFTGSLDGRGFVITGLTIDRPDANDVGLFGRTDNAISNLGLTDVNIAGGDRVGALAGTLTGSLNNSFSTGGTLSGNAEVGGLVGNNAGEVVNSYVTSSVDGVDRVGGLVGQTDGTISQSYALGTVNGSTDVGGLIGSREAGADVSDSFWLTDGNTGLDGVGAGDQGGVTGLDGTEFMNPDSFASWGTDIDTVGGSAASWRIYEGQSTPLLRSFLNDITVTAYDDYKVYDGNAYDGQHDPAAGGTGAGVRYGTDYDEFLTLFGEDGTPYSSDDIHSAALQYSGDSQGAVDAGTYRILPDGLWSDQSGYDITLTDGVLTIEAASLQVTVSIQDASKVYGEPDPAFSWYVSAGSLAEGDSLSGSLSRQPGEDVGRYAITGNITGDLTGGNYDVTLVNGVFTITPRSISINIADLEKVYGESDPALDYSLTGSAAPGDELDVVLSRAAGEDVGDYSITASLNGDVDSPNYDVSLDDGILTITPRPLVISADDLEKIYGEPDPSLTYHQEGSPGFDDSMEVTLVREAGSDVGSYTITPEVSGDVLSDNYVLSVHNGALQITPAALTVRAEDLETYWGLLPEEFPAVVEGLTNGDTEQDVFGDSLGVSSDLELPIPGQYTLSPTGTLVSNNYTASFESGTLNLLSSHPGSGYDEGLTSTQLPAREALGRENRANIYEGRELLDGRIDEIELGVLQGGNRLSEEQLADIGLLLPEPIRFDIESAVIDNRYIDMLREFADKLRYYPDVTLLIEGHTSMTGPLPLNERLARERASAVFSLLEELGVDPERMRTEGYDWRRPVADNNTPEGRARNRRAEVVRDEQDEADAASGQSGGEQ